MKQEAYNFSGMVEDKDVWISVCENCAITKENLLENNDCRRPEYVFPRQLIMTLLKTASHLSLSAASDPFSQHHCTAIHSIKVIKDWYDTDKGKRELINKVLEELCLPKDFIKKISSASK